MESDDGVELPAADQVLHDRRGVEVSSATAKRTLIKKGLYKAGEGIPI